MNLAVMNLVASRIDQKQKPILSLNHLETLFCCEGHFATIIMFANERFDSSVDSLVSFEIGELGKLLAAIITLVQEYLLMHFILVSVEGIF